MPLFEVGYSSSARRPAPRRRRASLPCRRGPATSARIDRRCRWARARPRRQTSGVNTIPFTPTSSKWALYKHFQRRQKPQTPPQLCLKAQHILHSPPITSSTIHHLSSIHPSVLCFPPSSSVPSEGPVQSESLAELRLSRLISKSCLFHLSKCLHSRLHYERADKGCLLSSR